MLVLPIKKKWFDMILSGGKKEEYRETSSYWMVRFAKVFGECAYGIVYPKCLETESLVAEVMFRNGYRKNSPSFIAKCTLSVGTGKEEWGAEPGKEYYVLSILEVKERKTMLLRQRTGVILW